MMNPTRLLRIVTAPISFRHLISGQAAYFAALGFDVLLACSDGAEMEDVKRREGVALKIIPFTRKITPIHDIKCLWLLIQLMLKYKPDIVHTQTPKAGLLGMIAAWFCGVPVRIHTVGGLPLMEAIGTKRIILDVTERITYFFAHQILPNSHRMAEWMVSKNLVRKNKFRVLGQGSSNGINSEYFSASAVPQDVEEIRASLGVPNHAFLMIFIGRLVRDKGLIELAQSFDRLSQEFQHVWLLLCGPWERELDPLPESIEQILLNHPRIISAGYLHDIRPHLKAANLLVFPSYREGFPNVPMQAGAMGLPMVVSDINGCNEIVQHGVNGWIVPVKNSEALCMQLRTLISDPQMVADAAKISRYNIVSRFNQLMLWNEIHLLYKEYLNESFETHRRFVFEWRKWILVRRQSFDFKQLYTRGINILDVFLMRPDEFDFLNEVNRAEQIFLYDLCISIYEKEYLQESL